jgi:hypothetical protein
MVSVLFLIFSTFYFSNLVIEREREGKARLVKLQTFSFFHPSNDIIKNNNNEKEKILFYKSYIKNIEEEFLFIMIIIINSHIYKIIR